MQRAGSSSASNKIRNDTHRPASRFSSVTSATPAKKITFFKSGDAQFTGVRMAIHKRSFKCFDALLDDLSQKVPLPFGVRTITTPRGIHSIQRLEQLEDGGCYLCSDRRYVKPIDVEAAGKRPTVWHHSHPHNSRKRPSRPEEPPTSQSGHHYHRHPKRIVLVKNNDPTVRRSILLSRRTARSLRVFMDEISELMQCHVRKLYTLEGRKIDSTQSLMQCPSVLVCVGREPFKPLLLENLRKHSDEKLPGMGTRSRSSTCSEGHESKKNVNFGLETKKSIIHPRSDSSNRSTRFSLSSEKSYSNGLCMTPGQSGCVSTCPYTKEVILNDDIEKRVLVNKDGSLSVEMKVRFRLVNDETLQWSTEIKKSAITLNESNSVKERDVHYLQSKSEYSDPESNSACEAEEACAPKLHRKHLEESHCQNCCNHCQEYDIWKNPVHKDNGDDRARNSRSSSGSSHKIMCKKSSVDSIHTISRSSEEYTEHVVEKASCFQQTVEEGDTRVEYCSVNRCCSRSELLGTATKLKTKSPNENTCETNIANVCHCNGDRKSNLLFENTLTDLGIFEVPKGTEDRPISAVSNSSKVLESLKEDQDDDYDDLPPSASRASVWSQSDNLEPKKLFTCVHCYSGQESQNFHLSPRPPSMVSSCSAHSSKHKRYRSMHATPDSARSSISKVSSRPPSYICGATTPGSMASDTQSGLDGEIPISASKDSIVSNTSKLRTHIHKAGVSDMHGVCEEGTESGEKAKSAISTNTSVSGKSRNSSACPYCKGCESSVPTASRLSGNTQDAQAQDADKGSEVKSVGGRSSRSHRSEASAKSNKCTQKMYVVSNVLENGETVQSNLESQNIEVRSVSALSGLSNPSATSKQSNRSNHAACEKSSVAESLISENAGVDDVQKRTKSAMSVKSNASAKSNMSSVLQDEASTTSVLDIQKTEDNCQDVRAVSPVSGKSNKSSKSRLSHKSNCSNYDRPKIPKCNNSNNSGQTPQDKDSERRDNPVSTASASHGQEPEITEELRVDSAMSMKSNASSKHPSSVLGNTRKSVTSQDERMEDTVSPVDTAPETKFDQDSELTLQERAGSELSHTSKTSKKSSTSSKNLLLLQDNVKCTKLNETENNTAQASDMKSEERVPSAMSGKSHSTTRSHRSHKSDNIADTATISEQIATALVTENLQESVDEERPTSANSKSSKMSAKSDTCSERASQSVLKPPGQTDDKRENAQNSLTVCSPSHKKMKKVLAPRTSKSPITTGSKIPANSRESKKSTGSKCHCSLNSNLKANSNIQSNIDGYVQKSAESPAPSPYGQSDEPLSPTSTASVSLGLGEEDKSDVLSERSISSTKSQILEHKCQLERSTPEAAMSDHAADSSETVKTKERAKTASSVSSAVSKKSRRSTVSHGLSKSSERALSPTSIEKADSVISTKSKADSVASHPSENDSTINQSKDAPQAVTENSNHDESQIDKSSTRSGSSSKCNQNKTTATPKSRDQRLAKNPKLSTSYLKIKATNIPSDCASDTSSVKSSKSENKIIVKEEQILKESSVVMSDITHNSVNPAQEIPPKILMPIIHLDTSSDSVLSHTFSAADLLREKVGNARPFSRGSGSNTGKNCDTEEAKSVESKCEKRSKSKQKKLSTSSQNKIEDQCLKLLPSSLPNASPVEFINDWLRKIPTDGLIYEMEDEFNEEHNKSIPHVITVNEEEEENLQNKASEISENVMSMNESQEIEEDPVQEDVGVISNETEAFNEPCETNAAITDPSPLPKLIKREGFPARCHSSVQVMKVLLSPKLDRCNSLPEVSNVYGRKLSTSAKGLLDCLANLQLIDSDPKNSKGDKYNEIASILQSLWIYEPSESEQEKQNIKDQCSAEDELNPRSSSGVDVSSGSIGSGKGSNNGGVEKSETAQERTASVIDQEALQIQEDTVQEEEVDPSSVTPENAHVPSDPLTPDIAERVQCSPQNENLKDMEQTNEDLLPENQKGSELSNKSSGNETNGMKSPADEETDAQENTNSEMPPSVQRSVLTRRVSQDPDPVWVLSLLKKLEKQFMSHYANAMAEFKVKWDLDDNEMLDKMISELKQEVEKRIQSSINRELQKIQSRAGRTPRPPISALSRDSTVQTEQRRKRLKVMRNKSINSSRSEDMNTASGTEFSDQRSEDDYCPCDTCLQKKMASKAVQRAEALSLAPVLQEFDLRKILQTKRLPPTTMTTKSQHEEPAHLKEGTRCSNVQSNLDVVHEESKVHNDVKSQIDEDKVEVEDTPEEAQTSSENLIEDKNLLSKNHNKDARFVNDEGEEVGNVLCDDGNKTEEENSEVQAAEDGTVEKDEEKAEEGGTEAEEENVLKEQETDDKEEDVENREASVAVDDGEAEDAEDRGAGKEEEEVMEENENGEHCDEGETNKKGETGGEPKEQEVEEEEADEGEEKVEPAEEGNVTEGGNGDESESALDGKISGDESRELDKVEGACENDGEDEKDDGPSNEDHVDEIQDASSQVQSEAKDEAGEDFEQTEGGNCGTDKEQQDEMEAKNIDDANDQTESPDHNTEEKTKSEKEGLAEQLTSDGTDADTSGQACDSGHRLIKQVTKTSVESQPGSMESATSQIAKLKDIHSFMESSESQDDNIVVITKQSPFTERRSISSRHGNKDDIENELIEWQISPKRRNRSPARANKQRRPKDSDVKVDDLKF